MSISTVTPPRSWLGRRLSSLRWHVRTRADAWLAVRMLAWRVALPGLKRVIPLERLVRAMHRRPGPPGDEERIIRLAAWIYGSRPVTGGKNCLERSLVVYRYLSEVTPDARLVVGVRSVGNGVEGHAWVATGDRALAAVTDERGAYEPVVSFGPAGRILEEVARGD